MALPAASTLTALTVMGPLVVGIVWLLEPWAGPKRTSMTHQARSGPGHLDIALLILTVADPQRNTFLIWEDGL